VQPFLVLRDGRPVGRIAAIENRSHNEYHQDRTGFFGFFESIDDVQVARRLVGVASEWLAERKLDSMRGPYNPSINDDCGVLLEGFDEKAYVFMPVNPGYYGRLLEEAGLRVVRELFAFEVALTGQTPTRIERVVRRTMRGTNARVRPIDLSNIESDLEIFRDLYNCTLDRNWGFVPITMEDLREAAKHLRAIAIPELFLFVELDGKPIAFGMTLPNIAEALQAARGRCGILRLIESVLRVKFGKMQSMRLAVLGTHPDYRDRAYGALVYAAIFMEGSRRGMKTCEVSWIDEDNVEILNAIHAMECRKTKVYGIFERAIS